MHRDGSDRPGEAPVIVLSSDEEPPPPPPGVRPPSVPAVVDVTMEEREPEDWYEEPQLGDAAMEDAEEDDDDEEVAEARQNRELCV